MKTFSVLICVSSKKIATMEVNLQMESLRTMGINSECQKMDIHLFVKPLLSFLCFSVVHEKVWNLNFLYVFQIFSENHWILSPKVFLPLNHLCLKHRKGSDFLRGWWDTDDFALTPCPVSHASHALVTVHVDAQAAIQQMGKRPWHGMHAFDYSWWSLPFVLLPQRSL